MLLVQVTRLTMRDVAGAFGATVAKFVEGGAKVSKRDAKLALALGPCARAIDIVVHDNDDNRHPEVMEIEGRDGGLWDYAVVEKEIEGRDGGLWDYAVSDDDVELDDEKKEAVRRRRRHGSSDVAPTGNTYDDIANSPPPYLRSVVRRMGTVRPHLMKKVRCASSRSRMQTQTGGSEATKGRPGRVPAALWLC